MGFLNIIVLVAVMLICNYISAIFFIIIFLPYFLRFHYIFITSIVSGQCPPPNRVYNDKPTCFSDSDCQKWGKVCCRNQHNTKSCTDRAPWRHDSHIDNKQKYSGGGGGGQFCNGVKCMPYEVCKQDPITKRLKCQRP